MKKKNKIKIEITLTCYQLMQSERQVQQFHLPDGLLLHLHLSTTGHICNNTSSKLREYSWNLKVYSVHERTLQSFQTYLHYPQNFTHCHYPLFLNWNNVLYQVLYQNSRHLEAKKNRIPGSATNPFQTDHNCLLTDWMDSRRRITVIRLVVLVGSRNHPVLESDSICKGVCTLEVG